MITLNKPGEDNTDKLIYLACPYTHSDPLVKHYRFLAANYVAAQMAALGLHVFSPISHSHPIALAGDLPGTWEYWERYDRKLLAACTDVYVMCLPGWENSVGVAAEIDIANELGLNVVYIMGNIEGVDVPDQTGGEFVNRLESTKGLDPSLIVPTNLKSTPDNPE